MHITETLLVFHVLSAATWIGASFYNAFLGPRFAAAGGPAAVAWIKAVGEAALKFFMPAAVLTLLTGIGLVLSDDAFDWGDLFVSIGLAVVIVGALIASFALSPATRAALAAVESGDFAAAGAAGRRAANWGRAISLLLVVAVVVMVLKTGAG